MSGPQRKTFGRVLLIALTFSMLTQTTRPILASASQSHSGGAAPEKPYPGDWTVADTAGAVVGGALLGAVEGAILAAAETCLVGTYGGLAAGAVVGAAEGASVGYVAYAASVAADGGRTASIAPYPDSVLDGRG